MRLEVSKDLLVELAVAHDRLWDVVLNLLEGVNRSREVYYPCYQCVLRPGDIVLDLGLLIDEQPVELSAKLVKRLVQKGVFQYKLLACD